MQAEDLTAKTAFELLYKALPSERFELRDKYVDPGKIAIHL